METKMNTSRKIILLLILIPLLVLQGCAGMSTFPSEDSPMGKKISLRSAMRKLWEDHITWTRLYIISAVSDLPDKDETAKRLLQNQADIGNAIKPFYGDAAGDRLSALLKDHILTAAQLIAAAKGNEAAKMEDAKKRWYANADDIASFLGNANPKNWPPGDLKAMLREHLDLTTAEVVARLQGDWKGDVAAYDKIHGQALMMADALSSGIVMQFPDKFHSASTGMGGMSGMGSMSHGY